MRSSKPFKPYKPKNITNVATAPTKFRDMGISRNMQPTNRPTLSKFRDMGILQNVNSKNNSSPNKFRDMGISRNMQSTNKTAPTKFRDMGISRNMQSTNKTAPTKFRNLPPISDNSTNSNTNNSFSGYKNNRSDGLKTFRNTSNLKTQTYKPRKNHTRQKKIKSEKYVDISSLSNINNRPESYNDGWDLYDENDNELNCIIGGICYKITIPKNQSKESMIKSIQNINSKTTPTTNDDLDADDKFIKLYLNMKYCVEDWDNIVNLIEKNKYNMDIILEAICYESYKINNIDKQHKAIKKKLRQINTLKKRGTNDLNLEQSKKLESEDLLVLKKNTIEYIQRISQSP